MRTGSAFLIAAFASTLTILSALPACALVAKRVIAADKVPSRQVLLNTSFEGKGEDGAADWKFWDNGYAVTDSEKYSGTNSIVCKLSDLKTERGASQTIQLNQTVPTAIVASGWSKAAEVSGSPGPDYSLYLDLEYRDGTPLWGQTANFSIGTHDWEKRTVFLVPTKPIKQVTVHAIFRHHTGAAWFDDFELQELQSPSAAQSFDGVYVLPETKAAQSPNDWVTVAPTMQGMKLQLSPTTGLMAFNGGQPGGGVLVRDVAADSDFHRLTGILKKSDRGWKYEGEVAELGLSCSALFAEQAGALRLDATVRDTRRTDRAVSVYFALPVAATRWHDDPRRSRSIDAKTEFRNTTPDGAGARGYHSLYPMGCVTNDASGVVLAMPLDVPRLSRFAYNTESQELFAAFDFGLTPATKKFPSSASFSLMIYSSENRWGIRSALDRYYKLFPDHFKKRITHEGLWQAFSDIANIQNPEDFHFAIKEGNDNVAWDDAHNILTFVYTEPMTYWQTLPKETPRTYEAAVAYLDQQAKSDNVGAREYALVATTAAAKDESGRYSMTIENAPWCDGGVYALNADPDIIPKEGQLNKGTYELRHIEKAFEVSPDQLPGWNAFGSGYLFDTALPHSGQRSIRCESTTAGTAHGASQQVWINQTEPSPLMLSGWSKAQSVTGEKDNSYCLYADLVYTDGTSLWGQIASFEVGTHDWQKVELVIQPEKPVRSASVHCLFRNNHTGKAWFDDVFLGPANTTTNLLKSPDFDTAPRPPPVLDGTYIDSLEGWANIRNFNADHFASTDLPLTFDPQTKKPMLLTIMSTYEFAKELHDRMRSKNKLMMANAMLHGYSFFAWLMDVMGTETNWNWGKQWHPMTDADLLFKRALCYQKPYCFLQNTHFDDFTHEMTEKYMQRSLFYGMFPGFFSENAATFHYFENPKWYNATRPLFRKYLPLIQEIAAAGWEPMTCAATDSEKVCVERYGSAGETVYFTILNDSLDPQVATITVDAKSVRMTNQNVTELLVGGKPAVEKANGLLKWKVELKSEEVRLYRIGQ